MSVSHKNAESERFFCQGEIEVEVEGECCPECQGDWLTAVNPDAEGKLGEPLALTCEVADGVDVKDVKW